ncbi:hypothetical protein Q8F55_000799 [Vanrija albida]|uniref:Protein kinase domain-containing protein n=1 Tax=Vanrija albida TaxID=181172 RepID=A0ABR3QEB2_9TREE
MVTTPALTPDPSPPATPPAPVDSRPSSPGEESSLPTLREFLRRGLFPIELASPPNGPVDERGAENVRGPTAQAGIVFAATPGQHVVVRFDKDAFAPFLSTLETQLELDRPVPSELIYEHEQAARRSLFYGPLSQTDLTAALYQAFGLVNSLVVNPALRRDPKNSHLWSTWNLEGDATYLARGVGGAASATSTAEAVCIANHARGHTAMALLEARLWAVFSHYDRPAFISEVESERGFTIYRSRASGRLRAFGSNLRDGQAAFWVDIMAQLWEKMHVYRCDTLVASSWFNTAVLNRTGANELRWSTMLPYGAPRPPADINLFELMLSLALYRSCDPFEPWVDWPGSPGLLPRATAPVFHDPTTDLPPTVQTFITGLDANETLQIVTELAQTYPTDEETLLSFFGRAATFGFDLVLGELINRGPIYDTFRVASVEPCDVEHDLVAKVVILSDFPAADTRRERGQAAVRAEVHNEAAMFCGPLQPLQGSLVPQFHGLYEGYFGANRTGILIMLLEDVGEPVAMRSADVDPDTALQIVALFKKLHAAGVCHGDVRAPHVCVSPTGTLRLVDFEGAWSVDACRPTERIDLDDELRSVYNEFGLEVPPELRDLTPPWLLPED